MNWKISRSKGNLIELFIDKVVLAIAVIAALVILFLFVIGKPNATKYAGQKLGPGKLDKFINNRTAKLQEKLKEEPRDSNSYEPKTPLYLSFIENSIKNVEVNIRFPLPHDSTETITAGNREYSLPAIGQIATPSTALVAMAAFVPTEELSDTFTYNQAETELADIDLVTVESSINAKQLYESFNTAFMGKHLPNEWRDKQYAKPVFAKVELQRRTLQKDGSPSQWAEVPKTKIFHLSKTLKIPTYTNEYEIQIALVQFEKPENRNEVLQPCVYDNAIPAEPWLSPSFYNEREKRLEKERQELERKRLEAEKAERLRGRISRTRRTSPVPSSEDDEPARPSVRSRTRPAEPTKRPPSRRRPPGPTETLSPTLTKEEQFNNIRLTENTDLATLENLVFWAHDDTTKPGEKYQYRIRIGILNPIAGKNWLSKEQKDLAEQVLLYSDFSKPSDIIEIPQRIHFFAIGSREIKRSNFIDKTAEVKVARYALGNWVTKTFTIRNGDEIGAVVNTADTRLKDSGIPVESIDLSTGFVMMDVRRVAKWTGSTYLRAKDFYELLYCKTGGPIQTVSTKEKFWPEEISKIYKEIEQAEASEPIVLLPRGMSQSSAQRRSSSSEGRFRSSPGERRRDAYGDYDE